MLGIQNSHPALGGTAGTGYLLGKASITHKCPGNARFELQIGNVPHGQEFLSICINPSVVKGLLANYEVIHWRLVSRAVFYNRWMKADLHAGGVLHKRGFNVTNLISNEGAIGIAPGLKDNPLHNRNVFTGPFIYEKEVPT